MTYEKFFNNFKVGDKVKLPIFDDNPINWVEIISVDEKRGTFEGISDNKNQFTWGVLDDWTKVNL
jgi:hypothetical protein